MYKNSKTCVNDKSSHIAAYAHKIMYLAKNELLPYHRWSLQILPKCKFMGHIYQCLWMSESWAIWAGGTSGWPEKPSYCRWHA